MPRLLDKRLGWLMLWLLCVAMVAVRICLLRLPPSPSGLSRLDELLLTSALLLMASTGFYWRWGASLYWANAGALVGDFPAAVSGASKREVVLGLMLFGGLFGLLLSGLQMAWRSGKHANYEE